MKRLPEISVVVAAISFALAVFSVALSCSSRVVQHPVPAIGNDAGVVTPAAAADAALTRKATCANAGDVFDDCW